MNLFSTVAHTDLPSDRRTTRQGRRSVLSRVALALGAGLAATMLFAAPIASQPAPTSTYTIDSAKSLIQFYVQAKITNVRGEFKKFSVSDFSMDGQDLSSMRGTIVIQPASVFTRDRKRDDHLRQDDFFWVAKFPEALATVTNLEHVSGDNYRATIELQIRDKSKEYVVPAKIERKTENGVERITARGKFIVNRQDFDLTGEHVANLVMNNDVELQFRVVLVKKNPAK